MWRNMWITILHSICILLDTFPLISISHSRLVDGAVVSKLLDSSMIFSSGTLWSKIPNAEDTSNRKSTTRRRRIVVLKRNHLQSIDPDTRTATRGEDDVVETKLTVNKQFNYGLWPDPQNIPFRFSTAHVDAYDTSELKTLLDAMSQISLELNNCIRFRLFNNELDGGGDHLLIAKTLNNGLPSATCFAFPGRLLRANRGQGQKLLLHNGAFGCLQTTREAAKFLINALGVRNEYNRPDRDRCLIAHPQNVHPDLMSLNLLRPYHERNVETLGTSLDVNSITMKDTEKYAVNANVSLFTIRDNCLSTINANNGRLLSNGDCVAISTLYSRLGCNPADCNRLLTSTTAPSPPALTSTSTTAPSTSITITVRDTTSGTSTTSPASSDSTISAATTTSPVTLLLSTATTENVAIGTSADTTTTGTQSTITTDNTTMFIATSGSSDTTTTAGDTTTRITTAEPAEPPDSITTTSTSTTTTMTLSTIVPTVTITTVATPPLTASTSVSTASDTTASSTIDTTTAAINANATTQIGTAEPAEPPDSITTTTTSASISSSVSTTTVTTTETITTTTTTPTTATITTTSTTTSSSIDNSDTTTVATNTTTEPTLAPNEPRVNETSTTEQPLPVDFFPIHFPLPTVSIPSAGIPNGRHSTTTTTSTRVVDSTASMVFHPDVLIMGVHVVTASTPSPSNDVKLSKYVANEDDLVMITTAATSSHVPLTSSHEVVKEEDNQNDDDDRDMIQWLTWLTSSLHNTTTTAPATRYNVHPSSTGHYDYLDEPSAADGILTYSTPDHSHKITDHTKVTFRSPSPRDDVPPVVLLAVKSFAPLITPRPALYAVTYCCCFLFFWTVRFFA